MNERTITIEPATRLEGHGKIVVDLDERGGVEDAFFSVTEFRGFEKFCEGRLIWDMPTITSRICGVCPVSHHLASVKACEAALGIEPPPAATKVRELLHMGQFIHSHALHFFFFAVPDLLPWEQDREAREKGFFGLLERQPDLARDAIRLRKGGQRIVDIVGGGRLHPVAAIPGGMTRHLGFADRAEMLDETATVLPIAEKAVDLVRKIFAENRAAFESFASFPSSWMGMCNDGNLELYDAPIRIVDEAGAVLAGFPGRDYLKYIGERVNARSWCKSTYYRERGFPGGCFRVAPLARLNIAESITTPLAQERHRDFKQLGNGKPLQSSLYYHYARMIELLYAVERARQLLEDPDIMSHDIRVPVKRKCRGEGVGVLEAPRGTLFHHYWATEDGRIERVNFVVSTAHNGEAMDRAVSAVAKEIVQHGRIAESELNRLEMAIRCYDPCLSCSTHALGRMPLEITLRGPGGEPIR
ncbi:MAG: Ni/Fe hydrogenase subunit alpha, partial [Planctomycetota bacterium]